jgi:hypothetical protein
LLISKGRFFLRFSANSLDYLEEALYIKTDLLRNKSVAQQDYNETGEWDMRELNVGGVPRGKDYFGREDLIENLWARLKRDNVLLVAPRRFGKTGAMYRLLDEPREPFRPLYINVEHIMSAADFMVEFLAALLRDHHFSRMLNNLREETKGLGRFLRNLPESIDMGGIKVILRDNTDVRQQWISYGERVMSILAKDKLHLLLLIDEFAIMIDNIAQRSSEEAERFLRWFRAVRTAPETKARFVFGGSINLIATLDAMGLVDTVNDLSIVRLEPFDTKTAKRFVETIFTSRRVKLMPKVRDTILELVGAPIPYLLSVLLTAIFDRQRATRKKVSVEMVNAAFQDDLLGGATAAVFRHYRSRIDQYSWDIVSLGKPGTARYALPNFSKNRQSTA